MQEAVMTVPAFRFAPSPNGELHLGHAYSALCNAHMAAEMGGRFLVRMEDIDTVRCSAVHASMALEDLSWLGLSWEEPVRFQSQHLTDYDKMQERLSGMGLLYPCFCSRRVWTARCTREDRDPDGHPRYDGACWRLSRSVIRRRMADGEPHCMRIHMASAMSLAGGSQDTSISLWGDMVLMRRDIGTSYHIAVVADDALQNITHVVRGRDLEAATGIHTLLQALLGLPTPAYIHHRLIGDDAGRKLSKSCSSVSLRMLRNAGVSPAEVRTALGFI